MSRLKDNLSMHWPLALATVLFIPAVCRYVALGSWEEHIVWATFALLGFVATAFPEEVSSWTGRYDWTFRSFWTYPASWVQIFGIIVQLLVLSKWP